MSSLLTDHLPNRGQQPPDPCLAVHALNPHALYSILIMYGHCLPALPLQYLGSCSRLEKLALVALLLESKATHKQVVTVKVREVSGWKV
jgi:hypothetical protein